jgi:hypothetical protein
VRLTSVAPVILSALIPAFAQQPTRIEGDPAVRRALEADVRAIYKSASHPAFLLLRSNPPGLNDYVNAEIIGTHVDGHLARIVMSAWNTNGRRSIEYYLVSGTLVHMYESFEFFEDNAPENAWRNFKGIAAWERRAYFRDEEAAYVETTGVRAPALDPKQLLSAVKKTRTLLQQRSRSAQLMR